MLFLHGLAVNADLWDMPEIRGVDFTFRSLPSVLHEAGHDVWMMNLRGCGAPTMLSEPPAGQDDWCVDHFVLYDLPAVLQMVREETGRNPFLVGNSMGAMTIAAHLQGAVLNQRGDEECVSADACVARERCAKIAGAILVEFPAALRWPRALYDDSGKLRWREIFKERGESHVGANYPFELMARAEWFQAIIGAVGEVRLDWLRPRTEWRRDLPKPFADAFDWLDGAVAKAGASWSQRFKGARNFRVETFSQGLLHAVDHMKAGVLKQLGDCVRAGGFVSALGEPQHVYSDHYHLIDAPVLVILGGRDRIANAEITREVFFDAVQSADKTIEVFDDLAHGEFEYAPAASDRVYPLIANWVTGRDKSADRL